MLTSSVFLEFRLAGGGGEGCRCARGKIPGIPSGGEGRWGLFTKTRRRCERGKILTSSVFLEFRLAGGVAGVHVSKFLEFRLAGEEEGLVPFGAGLSVGKFLVVTLNGARVGVRIAVAHRPPSVLTSLSREADAPAFPNDILD